MTPQKSFSMCVYYIKTEQIPRKAPLYISVNEIPLKIAHIHCECTHAFVVPTPPQLECCFFSVIVTKKKKKKNLLTSEERTDVELQAGHSLAIILLFISYFICTYESKTFQFSF